MQPMSNRLPTGPGSRGGRWHDKTYRSAYFAAWRKAHPEYVERDNQRRLRTHAFTRLTRVVTGGAYSRPSKAA